MLASNPRYPFALRDALPFRGRCAADAWDGAAGRGGVRPFRGGRRYWLTLLIIAAVAGIIWVERGSPGLGVAHLALFTVILVLVVALLGLGPGLLTTLGFVASLFVIADVQTTARLTMEQKALFLLALVAVNLVAAKSTLWRLRAEEQARIARRFAERLSLMTNGAMHYALYMVDRDGRIIHWNEAAARLTGWSGDQVMGRSVRLFCPDGDAEAERLDRAFACAGHEGSRTFDGEFVRADGSRFRQSCLITRLDGEDGDLRGFALLVRDVSKEHERELALQSVLQAAPDAVIVTDNQGRVRYGNAAAAAMFGYSAEGLDDICLDRLLPGSVAVPDCATSLDCRFHAMVAEAAFPRRVVARRCSGEDFPAEINIIRIEGTVGAHYTAFVRDLTEQEETRARLEALQMEMLHGSRYSAMGAMASMLAHELNQPLTAIAAYMEGSRILMQRGEGLDRARLDEIFAATAREAVHAGTIMSHLRHFVSNGEASLAIHSAEDVVTSTLSLVRSAAAAAAVSVDYRVEANAGPVFADLIQVQQALGNLCRNAIDAMRDAPERVLTLRAFCRDDKTTQFVVSDTGGGIPPELRDRLFDAFVTGKEHGTGVGLSLCRTIVEAHGGRIWAEPRAGGGTDFHFTLRRRKDRADD